MKVKYGTTRICFLIGKFAIKIPRLVRFKSYLYGLIANIDEVEFSKMNDERLCPVLFYIPFGFLLIMPKCDEIHESVVWFYDSSGNLICKYNKRRIMDKNGNLAYVAGNIFQVISNDFK